MSFGQYRTLTLPLTVRNGSISDLARSAESGHHYQREDWPRCTSLMSG